MPAPKGINPQIIGDRTTAIVLARLLQIYDIILIPFGENQRYDLVIDAGSGFIRVQCKTGRLREGSLRFAACSNTYHHPAPNRFRSKNYKESADLFGVYCPENDAVYLVPVAHIGRREGSLRIFPTRNNQARGIRWAKDYELTAGMAEHRGQAFPSRVAAFEPDSRLFEN